MANLTTVVYTGGALNASVAGTVSTVDALIIAIPNAATASDGSGTVVSGGTAQTLFSGVVPTNGFTVHNPDASEDLWISMTNTVTANGQGAIIVAQGGGSYTTPSGLKPAQAITLVATTSGHKFTAIKW